MIENGSLAEAITHLHTAIDRMIALTADEAAPVRLNAGQLLCSLDSVVIDRLVLAVDETSDPVLRIQAMKLLGVMGRSCPHLILPILLAVVRRHPDAEHVAAYEMATSTMLALSDEGTR
jgi:hypothetical protein